MCVWKRGGNNGTLPAQEEARGVKLPGGRLHEAGEIVGRQIERRGNDREREGGFYSSRYEQRTATTIGAPHQRGE